MRDNQEPALFVWDMTHFATDRLFDLLEWSPHLVVSDGALDFFRERAIKVDAIVTDFRQHDAVAQLMRDQWPVTSIAANEDGITAALKYLAENKHGAISVIGAPLALLEQLDVWRAFETVSVYVDRVRWSLVRKGSFEKTVPPGQRTWSRSATGQRVLHPDANNRITLQMANPFWIGEEL